MHTQPSIAVPDDHPIRPESPADRAGYFVAGAGVPIVLLHSSLGSKSQWTTLAERLARRFRVIALDLCGYGDNAAVAPLAAFTLDDEVRLVTARLDQLVEPHLRVHVVGHSYGGLVALRFAQCRRGRVASLSLYDPVVFRALSGDDPALVGVSELAERVTALVMVGLRHDAASTFVDFWSGAGTFDSLPSPLQGSIIRHVDKVPFDFQAAARWPLSPVDLRTIAVPTLLLAGKRSPEILKRIIASLSRELPNRRVRWIDSGHMAPITDGDRVNPWIDAFVDACAVVATPGNEADKRGRFAGWWSGRPTSVDLG
jgi:pimeloyl-ACP methyl ester carboxylesterase